MSSKGLRCLGVAYKDELGEFSDYYSESHPAHKKLLDPAYYSSIESDLVFVGVVALRVSDFFVTCMLFLCLELKYVTWTLPNGKSNSGRHSRLVRSYDLCPTCFVRQSPSNYNLSLEFGRTMYRTRILCMKTPFILNKSNIM